jgi:hypothetical protein
MVDPTPGSGVLRGQCLDRRIDDPQRLVTGIDAWQRQRNAARARIKIKPAPKWAAHIQTRPKSRNQCAEVLGHDPEKWTPDKIMPNRNLRYFGRSARSR